ncbi:MAG: hypothetical protein AAF383_08820 [Cyanobacteria bacterium P01_A01_bin.83]
MNLKTEILRRIWQYVETSNPGTLIRLSDQEIVENLTKQVKNTLLLSSEDINTLSRYLEARIPLIRDLAYSKLAVS